MKTILVDAVLTFVDEEGTIFKDLQKLLDQFSNRKIILTNADYESTNKYNLNNMPYDVFTLKKNPPKTDPKYFEVMLNQFGLTGNDAIYFEHDPKAVQSALSAGIKSYFYDPEKKDLLALEKFLTSNIQ